MTETQPPASTPSPINRPVLARDLAVLAANGRTLMPSVSRISRLLPLDPFRALPGLLARVSNLSDADLVILIDTLVAELGAIRNQWPARDSVSPEVLAAWKRLAEVLAASE